MNFITTSFIIMKIDFTDAELETIAAAMDDYIAYDDPDADPEAGVCLRFGGTDRSGTQW